MPRRVGCVAATHLLSPFVPPFTETKCIQYWAACWESNRSDALATYMTPVEELIRLTRLPTVTVLSVNRNVYMMY
jgi:hypothetical protein